MEPNYKGYFEFSSVNSKITTECLCDCTGGETYCLTSQLPQSSPFNISLFYSDCRNHTGHPIAMSKNYFEDDNLSGGLTKYQKYFDF